MSQTSRIVQERIIPVPKHLLKYRNEISPYTKTKDFKPAMGNRILLNTKKSKSALVRGQTMIDNQEDNMATLIKVERNYVRKLINSPSKQPSKSPLLTQSHKLTHSNKVSTTRYRFESLTVCNFLTSSPNKKKTTTTNRVKFAYTPEILIKKK
ncbi:hypothetical protein SteCoe_25167 [Stentor coeruleus]|uniref:Uncharacterized protein n=1 Tax=Stentor coeruleus TaxID=5963 RepID=A0A1R2BFZ4_9CILI|nr:hypothetical protein SteCoe_25167 [Stentor coeruleus]